MRRLRISGRIISSCIGACAAAILVIGLTSYGQEIAGGSTPVARNASSAHQRLLATAAPVSGLRVSNSPKVSERYRQFPLSFEPNRQQTSPNVKFLARGEGYILFLTDKDAVFSLGKAPHAASVMSMSLVGANQKPDFSGMEELPGKSNYLIGNKPENWHTNIPNYRKVAEHNIYPGIDLLYYGTQRQLEYDFVVAPGASPSKIQIAFKGAKNLHTDAQGDLVLSVAGKNDTRLHKPVAYQETSSEKQLVAANFVLKGKNRVALEVGAYDASRPLIVDPILSYSTFLGGSGIDGANSIAVAPDNTAFIAGGTFSADFPGAHSIQPTHGGPDDFDKDAFVAKISADGSTLLYSTYLGGKSSEVANGIAVDTFGNAYVAGTTDSPDFPVTFGSFNTMCGGDGLCGASWNTNGLIVENAFVAKLNSAGSGLIYSGFLGEYDDVTGNAIAVDGNGNAYVTGQVSQNFLPTVVITLPGTGPLPFPDGDAIQPPFCVVEPSRPPELPSYPCAANAYDFGISGTANAYVTKISSTGSTILYSSYLGGSTEDVGYGITADNSGNAYVTGLSYSANFPVSFPAISTTYGGAGDAFAAKVNTNASGPGSLVFATYLGGSALDQGNAIALDANGNVYVAGATNSIASTLTFVPPAGAAQADCTLDGAAACEGDAFIAKLDPTFALSYFTYLGGSKADSATGIAVDSLGNAYITGSTVSGASRSDIPFPIVAATAFQPAYAGGNADSFVAKLNPTGSALVYSSYLGGTNTEIASGIAVDADGSAYVAGQTCSNDFPLANPLQAVPGGNCDAYVAKISILNGFAFNPAGLVFSAQSLNTTSQPQIVTLTNGDSPQTITSIAVSGNNASDFAETTTCPTGTSLIAGATCTITVSFTPTAPGIRKAQVVITDTAPGSPHFVNLTGNTSTVTLSASSLAFGLQQVGVPSAPQVVTVTNIGSAALTFSGISASGDFSETDNCAKVALQPNTNCVVQVTFTPSAAVASVGAITLTDNGSGSPQVILTTGTGVLEPQATLSTASLGFPGQPIGVASSAQSMTLTNTGNAPLNIASIVLPSSDFSLSNNTCGSILSPNAFCTISVTFTPTAAGSRTATITITDNAANVPGSVQTVQLSGIGQAVPVFTLSTNALTFGGQSIGTTSAAQPVTLTNTGSAALIISNIASNGDFAELSNCPTSVAAGANCTINVTFTPTAAGNRFGTVTITDNASNSPQTIALSGVGNAIPQASISVASLGFVDQPIGTTSGAQSVTLSNTGTLPLNVASIVATGDFAESSNCGSILSPSAGCTINVTFTPTAAGSRTGTLTITDNAGSVVGTTQTVQLSGSGQAIPVVSLSTSTLTFAGQAIGTTSALQPVTLTNIGGAALTISNVAASGDFAQANNCPASVAAGASCTINITFTPTAIGNRFGTVTITDTAANSPQTISLSGNGNASPQASVSVPSLGFTTQPIGSTSPTQAVTLSNLGTAPLNVASIVATGDFGQNNTCGSILAASTNCLITVTFTPTAAGTRNGTLTITDNTGNVAGSTQTVLLSGTGQAVPVVSVSTITLTFASQTIGTTSAAQSVTLTNAGNAALTISNILSAGDFSQLSNCPTSVAPASSCTIDITFTPTTAGNRFGTVTITDNAGNSPQTIALSGIGAATPLASISVASLGFPGQPVSSTSASQTVTLSNIGDAALSVSSIIATGDFGESSNCGAILSAGASCTINVTFTPTAAGTRAGTLTITDNSGNLAGTAQNVLLSGIGQAIPVVSLSTSTLTFAGQPVGTTSGGQPVTLTNTGSAALVISNVAPSGDFAQVNNCPASVAAGASCIINVSFTPTVSGNRFGTVTITDNAADSPETITLSGNGNATPQASVSVASLGFASQPISSTSTAQLVTLSNPGDATLSVAGIVVTGDFAQSSTCGALLSAGTNCTISVTFTPTAAGTRNGTLTITDDTGNVAGSAQTVLLSGTGLAVPVVSLSTTTLTFGGQALGTTSAPQSVTLTNTGSAALTISNLAPTGDFGELSDCPTSVAAGATCTITVTFTPTVAGNRFGTVTITDNAGNSPQTIALSGIGNAIPQASISAASLGFAGQPIGTTSAAQSVTLTNTGTLPLSVASLVASGDFAENSTCGSILAGGGSCTINVTFTPTAIGNRTGTLTITDNAGNIPGTTQTIQLSGLGQAVPVVSLSTSTLTFSSQAVGTTSAAQSVTLTNTGGGALTISNVTVGGDFAQINNCPSSVAAGASCSISVTFTPTVGGNRFGSVTITDNAASSPQTITLSGNGSASPQASVSVPSLGFASQPIGSTSAAQAVTLTNTGAAPLNVTGIVATGDFGQSNTCGAILAPSTNCTINVTFAPTAAGTRNGTLTFTDNTGNVAGSTQTVLLSGIGQAVPVATLSSNTLTFAAQAIGSTSAPQAITLSNTGSAALIISGVTATGDFAQINNCPASVAPGTGCTINVTFSPLASGNLFGSVTITDNATNSPQTVAMSGTGTGASFQVNSLTSTLAVPAGTAASYSLSVTSPNGFNQSVVLSCTAPATLSCVVSPSVVTPSAIPSPAATLTIGTELRTSVPPSSRIKIDPSNFLRHFPGTWLIWMAAIFMILTAAAVRRRPITATFGCTVVLLLVSAACGAGGGAPGVPAGTPAGNYQVTVTATSGATTTTTQVTVQVK